MAVDEFGGMAVKKEIKVVHACHVGKGTWTFLTTWTSAYKPVLTNCWTLTNTLSSTISSSTATVFKKPTEDYPGGRTSSLPPISVLSKIRRSDRRWRTKGSKGGHFPNCFPERRGTGSRTAWPAPPAPSLWSLAVVQEEEVSHKHPLLTKKELLGRPGELVGDCGVYLSDIFPFPPSLVYHNAICCALSMGQVPHELQCHPSELATIWPLKHPT